MRLPVLILSMLVCLYAGYAAADLQFPDPVAGAEPLKLGSVPLQPQRYQGLLNLHTPEELTLLLARADAAAQAVDYQAGNPVELVLHGDEIGLFERSHYRENKELVDTAARLVAFNVVDIKVCRRWMASHEITADDLPPFVQLVDDGPAEVRRMEFEGYVSF